ncbi:phage tail protein [Cereibacter azotoformans]|uniref:phage tail protein n=1 Tax=Cereibacter azotoformans TaxID=43057 RepID=UPI003B222D1C
MAWTRRTGTPDVQLDIDTRDVNRLIRSLEASEESVRKAVSRALRRTASALRVRASKRIVPELQLRRAMEFRRRLRNMKVRVDKTGGEVGIWVGLNDMGVSRFKGRAREYAGGATFRQTEFPGAFVAVHRGRRSIWKRSAAGRFPIVEQQLPIKDQIDPILEDEIFPDAVQIFLRLFMADLRARTIYGVGK